MRTFTFSTAILAIFLALATLASAQLADSVAQPFERAFDDTAILGERALLEARQAANTTTTASAPDTTSTGSAPLGGDAVVVESGCSVDNKLSSNQQASWGNGFINTCCGFDQGTQCWYRNQANVPDSEECTIPNCADLESDDSSKMLGFVPLNSTNGSGKYGNIFLSLGMLSPAGIMVPMLGAVIATAVMVCAMNTL
ncbi:hypothetical protein PSEUBRA_003043 [Kalmanozyma brasiliensis GHG001]|uniref:Uncharacterized protein n=1 Tax=Kalmanozyma brasiliensis (strain GHG001) TaxID=1365824 RepID=V5EBV4_KALBG|nr:uncharacterized protein PSEUBRA_003043 [Kalmanozyma brasiliensis GHG001]EST07916.1 hypothetical protein PSEUBRA_003043 [Kalmanozyma brasiliensis GHG001]